MSFGLLNFTFVMIGLAGLSLPVIAHLLSRRNFNVVEWGAMQFLELRRSAKRKLRLEQLLLLLLRMFLIALIALAFARPWAQGGLLTSFVTGPPRDVMIVLDGSHSMGWERKADTPHTAARQWVHRFLEELRPGDTVGLIDARDRSRVVLDPPTRDFSLVRQAVDGLPAPAGSSNLADAAIQAAQTLARADNSVREIVILTDGQAHGWHADDENLWLRFDDLLAQASVKPRVWVVDVAQIVAEDRTNFSVDRLQLSRELSARGYPVQVSTTIRYSGGTEAVMRRVHFEVDGQRISEKSLQIRLQPGGENSIEFEHRFESAGSHVVSVVLDGDNLPGDDRSSAALEVTAAVPVLLVDGDPRVDPVESETHFARLALSPPSNPTPWVEATRIPADQLAQHDLQNFAAVLLCNVNRFTDEEVDRLRDYVASGGGLFVALGDKVDAGNYNETLYAAGRGLLPARLESIEQDELAILQGVRVVDDSLEVPWMTRFRAIYDGGMTDARFAQWWKVTPARGNGTTADDSGKPTALKISDPVTAARLNTSDPLLISRNYGLGRVLLMTAPLDADWSTFPTKHDYVSFLHEAVFHLAAGRVVRNVDAGMPLSLPVPDDLDLSEYAFFDPAGEEHQPLVAENNNRRTARLDETSLPGVYQFRHTDENAPPGKLQLQHFVVNYDRGESDLTALGNDERVPLTENQRMTFVNDMAGLQQQMHAEGSRSELWKPLLFLFLAVLVCEVLLTRHLVRGGHAVETIEEPGDDVEPYEEPEDWEEVYEPYDAPAT